MSKKLNEWIERYNRAKSTSRQCEVPIEGHAAKELIDTVLGLSAEVKELKIRLAAIETKGKLFE